MNLTVGRKCQRFIKRLLKFSEPIFNNICCLWEQGGFFVPFNLKTKCFPVGPQRKPKQELSDTAIVTKVFANSLAVVMKKQQHTYGYLVRKKAVLALRLEPTTIGLGIFGIGY